MNAVTFVAQLRTAHITNEFYALYERYAQRLLGRERALLAELLGPDSPAERELKAVGQPLSREQLADFVEGMTEAQRDRFVAAVTGDE